MDAALRLRPLLSARTSKESPGRGSVAFVRDRKTIGIMAVLLAASIILVFGDLDPGEPIPAIDCAYDTGDLRVNVSCFSVPVTDGSLMVTVLHRGGEPLTDAPVLVLPSEPGVVPSRDLSALSSSELLRYRDLVVVDPIATGQSSPLQTCDAYAQSPTIETLAACHDQSLDAGIPPERRTTPAFVDDLIEVRRSLAQGRSWSRWHALGRSHGAQVALRLAVADGTGVETLVLESPLPLEVPSFLARAIAYEPALTALSTACGEDRGCGRFEAPAVTAERIASRLHDASEAIDIPAIGSLPAIKTTVASTDFRRALSQALDLESMPEVLPWLLEHIDDAASEFGLAEKGRIGLAGLDTATRHPDTVDQLTWWSDVCAEQLPIVDSTSLDDVMASIPELVSPHAPRAVCSRWVAGARPADVETADLDLPILVFDRVIDPMGTDTWTHRVSELGGQTVVVESTVTERIPASTRCTADVAAQFMESRRSELDLGCASEPLDFMSWPVPIGAIRELGTTGETGPTVMAVLGLLIAAGFAGWAATAAPGARSRTAWLGTTILSVVSFVAGWLAIAMNSKLSGYVAQPFPAWFIFALPWLVVSAVIAAVVTTIQDVRRRMVGGHWPSRYGLVALGVSASILGAALLGRVPGL